MDCLKDDMCKNEINSDMTADRDMGTPVFVSIVRSCSTLHLILSEIFQLGLTVQAPARTLSAVFAFIISC